MKTFPKSVIKVMSAGGATVTCLPVQIDPQSPADSNPLSATATRTTAWQSAIFFRLGGVESKRDIELLTQAAGPFTLGIETDIIEHANASVVMLRLQVFIQSDDPLIGEVLLTPGGAESHYEILGLLGQQAELNWFFSDQQYRLLYQQSQPLDATWRQEFLALRSEAFKRDSLIRLSGKYNAQAAFAEVISRYSLR